MLVLRRVLLLRGRRALLSTVSAADGGSFKFDSLALDDDQLVPSPVVTQRVLEYLQVDSKNKERVLSTEEVRPLPYKALFAPNQVHKLTPLVRLGFQQLEGDSQAADAVFAALEPHANMARGAVWRQYFQRQFFLSGAPIRAYLRAYKVHRDALDASRAPVAAEEQEPDDDEDDEEEGDENDEPAASTKSKQAATSWRKEFPNKNKVVAILAEKKEWEWVPLHVASSIVKEFCFRGRFAEAIEAYASLPLADMVRQDVVAILQDYEQYPSVLYLYEVHRAMGSAVRPLDVAPELDALKKVGRVEEMDMRFQELPAKEQSRADIQKLMGN
ncbi:hypothetical protein JG687_00002875 [Phytophthora cactorum]|uniref:Uncharacterized protein n=1 Tax=Phytophthora cactorum TaxID=29920 RepID=A0A329SAW7_9STRA|nr:hypothetical protein Pcac1_g27266 [Phytophthora cactorum]KAG2826593.1 hypothetical protein PC111_g8906 [Phytophthora cactorum]KAG2831297.1 hypothetical protein PC112_g7330 [Phytophthora cactorum]KAG2866509.1 hypothetical protein PC113_g2788 [Phytophthora cactorum]KAG2900313.1 hypothetical protein PC115_g16247 [Phytophthora cactorum]